LSSASSANRLARSDSRVEIDPTGPVDLVEPVYLPARADRPVPDGSCRDVTLNRAVGVSHGLVDARSAVWSAALETVPHDVYHLPGYTCLEAAREAARPVAFVYTEPGRAFLLPLLVREIPGTALLDATSGYGYPGVACNAPLDEDAFWRRAADALMGSLSEAGVVSCFVRMHPLLPGRLDALARVGDLLQHGHTVSIDLTLSEDEIWNRIRSNHRRQIRAGLKRGLRVEVDNWSYLPEWVDVYYETMNRVQATAFYYFDRAYFEGLRGAVGECLHLVTVQDDGRVIGGGLFFEHDGIVQYHLGGTRTADLNQQPTKLVFDHVSRWAKARGNRVFHLGGGSGGRDDSLSHFKRGFSPDHPAFFTWRLIPDRAAYEDVGRRTGGALQDAPPSFFPAYRRPGGEASESWSI
jgi:hypothetical protein